jgi:hypothetical protein
MRAIGAVALDETNLDEIDRFEVYLDRLPGSKVHPSSEKFWSRAHNQELRETIDRNSEPALIAMMRFSEWLSSIGNYLSLVAYNPSHVNRWIQHYLAEFTNTDAMRLAPVDLRSQMSVLLPGTFSKAHLPQQWRLKESLGPTVLDKAVKQAFMFRSLKDCIAKLHEYVDLPNWLRQTYGPPVNSPEGQSSEVATMGS